MLGFVLFPLLLSTILFIVYLLTFWSNFFKDNQKNSPFECGFDPLSNMRKPFSLRFFLLVILFLVFDVEVVLLFPIIMLLKMSSMMTIIYSMSIFLTILLLGLLYEWKMGALEWSKM